MQRIQDLLSQQICCSTLSYSLRFVQVKIKIKGVRQQWRCAGWKQKSGTEATKDFSKDKPREVLKVLETQTKAARFVRVTVRIRRLTDLRKIAQLRKDVCS